MAYNTTNLTSAINLYEVTREINILSGYTFAYTILFLVFIITFALSAADDVKTRFLLGSFITTFISIIFYFIELIGVIGLVLPMFLLFAAIFMKILRGD